MYICNIHIKNIQIDVILNLEYMFVSTIIFWTLSRCPCNPLDQAHEALGVESCDKQHLRQPTKPPFSCLPCRWPSLESCSFQQCSNIKLGMGRSGASEYLVIFTGKMVMDKWMWGRWVPDFWGQRMFGGGLTHLDCEVCDVKAQPLAGASPALSQVGPTEHHLLSKWWI